MTSLRVDIEDVLRTQGRYDELSLLVPATNTGEKLRALMLFLARSRIDALSREQALEKSSKSEIEGLRVQNEKLTVALQAAEVRAGELSESLRKLQDRYIDVEQSRHELQGKAPLVLRTIEDLEAAFPGLPGDVKDGIAAMMFRKPPTLAVVACGAEENCAAE